jgi:uncharacterized protein YndB with AHSA1/START domain
MSIDLTARATTTIAAGRAAVWKALTDPAAIKQYMFGADVISDWRKGSSIVWKGEYQGKSYEDKGEILAIEPEKSLQYSHFSPLAGKPDLPENYHTVTITLSGDDGTTNVSLTQDKNGSEESRAESEKNWTMMLDGLKKNVER